MNGVGAGNYFANSSVGSTDGAVSVREELRYFPRRLEFNVESCTKFNYFESCFTTGQSSVRKVEAGRPSLFHRLTTG